MKAAWYLIYTKPKQECVALENLERQEYEVYLPMLPVRRRLQGQHQLVLEPMFPRYLFVRLTNGEDNWSPIRSTRGVANLVRFGVDAARVPDELINQLRERDATAKVESDVLRDFEPGKPVRIVAGALAGYEGIFSERSGERRALILLELASQYTRVKVSIDQIDVG